MSVHFIDAGSHSRPRTHRRSERGRRVDHFRSGVRVHDRTATERPRFQDLYQTPILGSLVGMGLESARLYFHSLDVWAARALGYVLDPFTLFAFSKYGFYAVPVYTLRRGPGVEGGLRF